ncbi:MAG: ATP-binding cassette domain-containing protein [Acetobacteraceae bacterium]|nr:ATP-binding cassette domain-containing protein [Acetobacteraceae bacterium]
MDCGPAVLKSLLEGFGVPVSYGRLREACQTEVDGTSIDTIEMVANQLGVDAEQMMLPADHLFLREAGAIPALIIVQQSNGGTHFVVIWRQLGGWLQVMDPSIGRRWVRRSRFVKELYSHQTSVPADDWRSWAASDEFLRPLQERIRHLDATDSVAAEFSEKALADPGWLSLGALDASVRLVQSLIDAGGISTGPSAIRLLNALFNETRSSTFDIFKVIPPSYWAVTPDLNSTDPLELRLALRGAVLLRIGGCDAPGLEPSADDAPALPAELEAALREPPTRPLSALLNLIRDEGAIRPLALVAAASAAVIALLIETLLFRAMLDVSRLLNLGGERLVALVALLIFAALLLLLQVPIVTETLRLGRQTEIRLRIALLRKMPRLTDHYFQSRAISDMADRSHAIHAVRQLPGLAVHLMQGLCELLATLAGTIVIDPHGALLAVAIVATAVAIPLASQSMVRERDLRVRNHSAALSGFYLDALLGIVPVRAHRAERAVRRQHEALLVEWARAGRRRLTATTSLDGAQSFVCAALAGWLLFSHFMRIGAVTGGDLLLVYWTLKLPAVAHSLAMLTQQLPAQQNVLARLMEPLSAPEEESGCDSPSPTGAPSSAISFTISDGAVLAAGHRILQDINLAIRPGEHVAIVGASGAGKSSLLGLLLGWHRLSAGTISLDGMPLTPETHEALRQSTAWIDPAIQIWNRSFAENLSYSSGDQALERLGEAIDTATLRDVLRNLPEGLQTKLGEGGALISGGEGQRVRLGRAFAQQDVRLALLDEPFRGIDRDRRRSLLVNVRSRWRGVTLLCVTHDVSETRLFDRVLVIDDGRIIEDGQPEQLTALPSRYRQLLNAERDVLGQLSESGDWRRVAIRDGRVHGDT